MSSTVDGMFDKKELEILTKNEPNLGTLTMSVNVFVLPVSNLIIHVFQVVTKVQLNFVAKQKFSPKFGSLSMNSRLSHFLHTAHTKKGSKTIIMDNLLSKYIEQNTQAEVGTLSG